jgi:hypothetical protein
VPRKSMNNLIRIDLENEAIKFRYENEN